ncbi:Protein-tyrosine-phosphatase MKP1 [Capsicum baccatum]|uniref:Protein-tyrosine-phosphatase MKP1 n=1 Tax=Capsicum baccatum TaxID=33114 RepID=A0A2G2WV76_CAPBA|nr:Protein-tyrosine-phosphatase MKP1 [Capsicum baccatum]
MSGKEDASDGGVDGSQEPCQLVNSVRMYCRSASWLSSRTSLPLLNPDIEQDGLESNGGNSSHGRRPLAPRSQQSYKARQRLPLLQPLAIARRSLDEWPRSGSDDIGEWPLPSTPSGRDTNSNSERLNLDLSNIHKNPEINAGLVRKEKIAFFDKECSKVAENVFLGGDAVAKDKDILNQNGITHVLNCIVCYEKVQAPIITVMEGEEPLYFCDAFSNFLPLKEKLKNGGDAVESSSKVCPGERKVDAYKIDFEIFQIATSGDFVPPFASCETEYETHLPVRESSWSMLRGKFVSGNMKDFVFSTKSDGVVDTGGASCNLVKPVVYRWPSLEKLATCSIDALDSKGSYIFIIPTSGFGKDAGGIPYKYDIPRAIWNPPFTRQGSLQPKYAARFGVPESDMPHDT